MEVLSHTPPTRLSDREMQDMERLRISVNKELQQCFQGYAADTAPREDGAPIDEPAIFQHYDGKYRERCLLASKSKTPIVVDPDRFLKEVEAFKRQQAVKKLTQSPIHTVDLAELDYEKIHEDAHSRFFLSSTCGVKVYTNGDAFLFPRACGAPNWPRHIQHSDGGIYVKNITVGALGFLVKTLHIQEQDKPNPDQVMAAQQPLPRRHGYLATLLRAICNIR